MRRAERAAKQFFLVTRGAQSCCWNPWREAWLLGRWFVTVEVKGDGGVARVVHISCCCLMNKKEGSSALGEVRSLLLLLLLLL
jgi:hypothetical protein